MFDSDKILTLAVLAIHGMVGCLSTLSNLDVWRKSTRYFEDRIPYGLQEECRNVLAEGSTLRMAISAALFSRVSHAVADQPGNAPRLEIDEPVLLLDEFAADRSASRRRR